MRMRINWCDRLMMMMMMMMMMMTRGLSEEGEGGRSERK